MKRLNGMDAYMLNVEQASGVQHTLKIAILDPSTAPGGYDFNALRDALRMMPNEFPWMHWKYLTVPFGLHHPVFVEDPDFDVDFHIRRVACPAPGDNRALCELIAHLYISPLDHNRPLWLIWVVEGLEGGKIANVMLFHHVYADGSGAAQMMQRSFRPQPYDFDLMPVSWVPPQLPSRWRLLVDGLRDLPGTWLRSLPQVVHGLREQGRLKRRYAEQGRQMPPNPLKDGRDTPFNDKLSACRSFAFETWKLEQLKRISHAFGITINDLFVACATSAFRDFLVSKDVDPDLGPLVVAIPFSRRPPADQDDGLGNTVKIDHLFLPIHLSDPLGRLAAVRASAQVMKEHFQETQGADISSVLNVIPDAAVKALSRHIAKQHGKNTPVGSTIISNVVGPKQTLYLGRYKLDNWLSTGQLPSGSIINTTAWSYADKFTLCVLGDKKAMPDAWFMIERFSAALDGYDMLSQAAAEAANRINTNHA